MKILLFPNFKKNNALNCALAVCDILKNFEIDVCVEEKFAAEFATKPFVLLGNAELLLKSCDIIIVIGGDGTILKCARLFGYAKIPILGINSGRLGFMSAVESNELGILEKLKTGDYSLEKRMMLDITHISDGKATSFTALNDLVIARHYHKISDFVVSVDNAVVGNPRADGLVFSTPTGSTAYSLSAGGPIIEPDIECIEFTPICSHSLFSRTVLFSADKIIEVRHDNPNDTEVYFCVDGADSMAFAVGDKLNITKSNFCINLINFKNNNFYDSINKKLMQSIKGIG
ncbi:MAG: NAD(+)/NADH kinase [Oscillospiraceae bacterium]